MTSSSICDVIVHLERWRERTSHTEIVPGDVFWNTLEKILNAKLQETLLCDEMTKIRFTDCKLLLSLVLLLIKRAL